MPNTVRVTHSANFDRWVRGFAMLGHDAVAEGESEWDEATRAFYESTQRVVHVITGALKASGRMVVTREGDRLVGVVQYGGGSVDYALAERVRGGTHDYLQRGWQETERGFGEALRRVWPQVRQSWS
jgi:hypothetical protein